MADDLYCSRADLYRYGLQRGLLANPGRIVAEVSASTNVLTLDDHGFEDDTPLLFRAEQGGSLPSPLVAGTTYYALRLTDATFQVAATASGAALDLTTAGESVVVSTALPFDEVIERYSRFVDGHLPAHLVPLEAPYPVLVVAVVAELAAQRLLQIAGQRSVSMNEVEAAAHKEISRWARGVPLRDARATAPTNLSVGWGDTSRGWSSDDPEVLT